MNERFIAQLLNLPNTFIGEAPIEVNNCQWVRVSAGTTENFFSNRVIDRPEYAVYIRDVLNEDACTRAEECLKTLRNWHDAYNALIVTRLPTFVGRDDKFRSVYSFRVQFITGG